MEFKISLLIVLINFAVTFGQEDSLSCEYSVFSDYSCRLIIFNPNGLDNFDKIEGTHMEDKTDDDVKEMDNYFYRNHISTNIPSIICVQFENLERIELRYLEIQNIDENSFKNCKNLSWLDLEHNAISTIPEDTFSANTELKRLILSFNQLTTLPDNLFKNQQNLEFLNLGVNNLSNRLDNIFNPLINLTYLNLSGNQITSLKIEWFSYLTKLKNLYLNTNQIKELPKNMFSSLRELAVIEIGRNNLTVIHADAFGDFRRPQWFDIQSNQIFAVDEMFLNNTNVMFLNILFNVCASQRFQDDSPSRHQIRIGLRTCFQNYEKLHV